MSYALRSDQNIPIDRRYGPRAQVRIPARTQSYSRFLLNSLGADSDDISDVTVRNLSCDGTATDNAKGLRIGMIVRLQIPLLGWRNAKVCWIRDGHAGCRFLVPLSQDTLRAAIATSPLLLANYPGLLLHIESADASPFWQNDKGAAPMTTDRRTKRFRLPAIRPDRRLSEWLPLLVPSASIAIAFFAWAILYALFY